MQVATFDLAAGTVDMTFDFTSQPVPLSQIISWSIQTVWTGTPVGVLSIEASNDVGTSTQGAGVIDWTPLSPSAVTINGAAGSFYHIKGNTPVKWIRLVYTATSGSGTMTKAIYFGKGP